MKTAKEPPSTAAISEIKKRISQAYPGLNDEPHRFNAPDEWDVEEDGWVAAGPTPLAGLSGATDRATTGSQDTLPK